MQYSLQFLQSIILMCQLDSAPVPTPPHGGTSPQILAQAGCWNTFINCTDRARMGSGYNEANALAVCMKTLGAPGQ